MPLYDLQARPLTTQWFPDCWRTIRRRLVPGGQFNFIIAGITRDVIGTHDRVTVPGFKAGANWWGLPWYDVYAIAARKNEELAAMMYGLMCVHAFKIHPDIWYTTKTHYVGHKHENRIYFSQRIFRI